MAMTKRAKRDLWPESELNTRTLQQKNASKTRTLRQEVGIEASKTRTLRQKVRQKHAPLGTQSTEKAKTASGGASLPPILRIATVPQTP